MKVIGITWFLYILQKIARGESNVWELEQGVRKPNGRLLRAVKGNCRL